MSNPTIESLMLQNFTVGLKKENPHTGHIEYTTYTPLALSALDASDAAKEANPGWNPVFVERDSKDYKIS
jgi:hypothetical protein